MSRPGNEGGSPGNAPPSLSIPLGPDVASAAALGVPGKGYFNVTGTTTITSLPTLPVGEVVVLQFAGILTLTYNATSLILQGSANLTTAAGDIIWLRSEGAGNWREITRRLAAAASAGAVTRVGGNTTEATTTSTTAVDILSVASLSIAVGTPVSVVHLIRRASGALSWTTTGMKLNTTVVLGVYLTSATENLALSVMSTTDFIYGVASYLQGGAQRTWQNGTTTNLSRGAFDTDMPTATLTDIVSRGQTNDALALAGHDEMHVYTRSVS